MLTGFSGLGTDTEGPAAACYSHGGTFDPVTGVCTPHTDPPAQPVHSPLSITAKWALGVAAVIALATGTYVVLRD